MPPSAIPDQERPRTCDTPSARTRPVGAISIVAPAPGFIQTKSRISCGVLTAYPPRLRSAKPAIVRVFYPGLDSLRDVWIAARCSSVASIGCLTEVEAPERAGAGRLAAGGLPIRGPRGYPCQSAPQRQERRARRPIAHELACGGLFYGAEVYFAGS